MSAERLDRLLSRLGYATRREVRALIRERRIEVKGVARPRPDTKVRPCDVRLDGAPLEDAGPLAIALYKPAGWICDRVPHDRHVFMLLPERWQRRRPPLSVAGRLDRDAEGLVILSDDGQLVHRLTHPRWHVPRVYRVRFAGALAEDAEMRVAEGMKLEGEAKPLRPAVLRRIGEREVELELSEGRYHQVKRMIAALGGRVASLRREAIGGLRLADLGLAPGEYRKLDAEMLARIGVPDRLPA